MPINKGRLISHSTVCAQGTWDDLWDGQSLCWPLSGLVAKHTMEALIRLCNLPGQLIQPASSTANTFRGPNRSVYCKAFFCSFSGLFVCPMCKEKWHHNEMITSLQPANYAWCLSQKRYSKPVSRWFINSVYHFPLGCENIIYTWNFARVLLSLIDCLHFSFCSLATQHKHGKHETMSFCSH